MLHLNGSHGEGGGQLLRTSLSLAALLGESVRITDIRAGRAKPGLRPQHLTAVQAVARISGAEVEGADLGSRELVFKPRSLRGGDYFFDVAEKTGSAGAVTLVVQALLPPLLAAREPATLTIRHPYDLTAEAEHQDPHHPAAHAIDGLPDTYWDSAYDAPVWIQVDLGESRQVDELTIHFWDEFSWQEYSYYVES